MAQSVELAQTSSTTSPCSRACQRQSDRAADEGLEQRRHPVGFREGLEGVPTGAFRSTKKCLSW